MNKYVEQAKDFLTPYLKPLMDKFRQLSAWQQVAISTGVVFGSSVAYLVTSYNVCKFVYPRKPKINYDLHGDINKNNGIIFFLHGWPDFTYIWDLQIKYFLSKGYCCIALEIPNYNVTKEIQNPWGYPVSIIVESFGDTIYNILSRKNKLDRDIIVVAHDWGALLAQLTYVNYRRPDDDGNSKLRIKKLILLDIGDVSALTPENGLAPPGYVFLNSIIFMLPRFLGTFAMRTLYKNGLANDRGLSQLGGLPEWIKEKQDNKKYFDSIINYFYFHVSKAFLLKEMDELKHILYVVNGRINELDDLSGILFIAATNPVHGQVFKFYSKQFREYVESKKCNKFEEWNCYHWIQYPGFGLPTKFNHTLENFITQES